MYMLFKNNRPVGNKKFNSYEKCRQWARKLLRQKRNDLDTVYCDLNDITYRTPSLKVSGYSIHAI